MGSLFHDGRQIELVAGRSIFEYADELKLRVPTSCGRSGECHECIVEVKRGLEVLNPITTAETFLRDNYRLACQATIANPVEDLEFALLRRQPQILTDSIKRKVKIDPLVRQHGNGVYLGDKRIDDYRGKIYGLAIDLGTTSVAMNLVDLETSSTLATVSYENPQRFGGSDIMHRISYDTDAFPGELQQVILSSVNFEIGEMARKFNFHRRQIYDVVVVGNSTMRDIFFGIDVESIGQKPYRSLTETDMENGNRSTTAISMNASDLGIRVFPKAEVYSGPLIGSHVGADVAADLLAIAMDEEEEVVVLVDVGTNTEVIVGNRHRMMAASCPAGPAFEGGEITYGMPGYDGAIESVKIDKKSVSYKTIGESEPQGICGSGLVDLLAELRRTGKMSEIGTYAPGTDHFYFASDQGMSLSRSDISALAQAKSANFCGQWIVLRKYGVPLDQISKIYLAGGFANYLNIDNAARIGFIVDAPVEKIVKVGNAALEGATIMLVSNLMRKTIEEIVRKIEHVELETTSDFFDIFVEGCMFKPMPKNFC